MWKGSRHRVRPLEAAPVCCSKDKEKSFKFCSDVEEKIVEKFNAEPCMIRIVRWTGDSNTDVWNGFIM